MQFVSLFLRSSALFWELDSRELLYMANSKGGLFLCDEKEPGMGKWKNQIQKSGVKAIYS